MSQWVLLWLPLRNEVTIRPVAEMLSAGRDAFRDNKPTDAVPLFIGTRESVQTSATFCDRKLMQRQEAKGAA